VAAAVPRVGGGRARGLTDLSVPPLDLWLLCRAQKSFALTGRAEGP
jgi:hypothetical protein